VAYNTFIGMKIVFINAMMEICFKTGADVDDLSSALSLATERIISDKYMRGGMGDGGGCHPRDNIALSWLSKKLNLSHDIFEDLMLAREDQTKFIAEVAERFGHREGGIVILGKAYKPETNLTVGSPALLLKYYLPSAQIFDPYIDLFKEGKLGDFHPNTCWVIATKHECFRDWIFPIGAIVIDPWGYIPDAEGVFVMRLGRNR
jgi:UDPglucose 6-dehydrogenase